jgi:hypothetical protein
LNRDHDERPIPPASPSICIRRSKQRFNFRLGEESDEPLVMFLARHHQDPLDEA